MPHRNREPRRPVRLGVRLKDNSGWSDAQIAEAVYDGALFNLFVRLADAFDIHPPARYEIDGAVPAAVLQGD